MDLIVSQLFIYPIKSMGGIELATSKVESRGLQYDRRWMLIDDQNRFISQRENSMLALFRVSISEVGLSVKLLYDSNEGIGVPFLSKDDHVIHQRIIVSIWDDRCEALVYPDEINDWFSDRLDMKCRLVYMSDDIHRKIDPKYTVENDITSFSDGYPILIIGQSSLDDLNSKLEDAIPMNRFRPNIVFTGGDPFQEDDMHSFRINQCEMRGVKLCARCNIPTIDQDTILTNSEPTATLAKYRLKEKKILFGQNVIAKTFGKIHVGNEVEIIPSR